MPERRSSSCGGGGLLSFRRLDALSAAQLAPLIRSSGVFRVKARRVRAFLDFLGREFHGRVGAMRRAEPSSLRQKLLAVHGLGPETADCIALYAAGKPFFVVDAYTRRVFSRLGHLRGGESYGEVQALLHASAERRRGPVRRLPRPDRAPGQGSLPHAATLCALPPRPDLPEAVGMIAAEASSCCVVALSPSSSAPLALAVLAAEGSAAGFLEALGRRQGRAQRLSADPAALRRPAARIGGARLRDRGLRGRAPGQVRPPEGQGRRGVSGPEAQSRSRFPDRDLRLQHHDVGLRASGAGLAGAQGQLLQPRVVRPRVASAPAREGRGGGGVPQLLRGGSRRAGRPASARGWGLRGCAAHPAAGPDRGLPAGGGEPGRGVPAQPVLEPHGPSAPGLGKATVSRAPEPVAVEVPAGAFRAVVYTVAEEGGAKTTWTFEAAPPHRLLRRSSDAGEDAVLLGSTRQPYWRQNGVGNEKFLRELGLRVPSRLP